MADYHFATVSPEGPWIFSYLSSNTGKCQGKKQSMNKHPTSESGLGFVKIVWILPNAFSPTFALEKKLHTYVCIPIVSSVT